MATLGFLQITVIWNKVYDVIIYLYDVTNKILSRNSNYVIEVVMWPNFGNSSISMREVTETSIYKYLTRKTNFFEGCCWLKFNNGLEILHQCGKRVKTKSQKVLGANSYVCRSYRRKTGTVGGGPPLPVSWIGLNQQCCLLHLDSIVPRHVIFYMLVSIFLPRFICLISVITLSLSFSFSLQWQ